MTKKRSTSGNQTNNRSGGNDVNADEVNITGDVVGRDMVSSTQNIETGGGAYVGDNMTVATGGEFVGRDKIINEAPAPIATFLHQLPSPPLDFTGRTTELAELLSNIEHGAIITGLRGMGGIGKTALALVLADQLKGKYPDAQFYLDLRGASDKPMPYLEAMQHVIRGYHPTAKLPDDPNDIAALYRSVLDRQCALLLMDNAANREQVEPLIPPKSCLLLVTSRQKFYVQGMRDPIDLGILSPEKSRELLLEIAKRIGGYAGEIAKLCGYLPLALRVVASTIAERVDFQPQEFVRRLSDTEQRLKLTGVDTALQVSYDLLSDGLKLRWCQLSVFPSDFDQLAVMYTWLGKYEQSLFDNVQDSLGELVKYSLITYDARVITHLTAERAQRVGRYSLHDLARLYTDQHLRSDEKAAIQLRHAEHYLNILRESQKLYSQGREKVVHGLNSFDQEWNNIQSGQAWATTNLEANRRATELCNDYCNAAVYLLDLRQGPSVRINWRNAALSAAAMLNLRIDQGMHLNHLGMDFEKQGNLRQAIDYFEKALVIAREEHDRRGEGLVLGNLGNAYSDMGDFENAIKYLTQQIIFSRETNNQQSLANGLGNLGVVYLDLNEPSKAVDLLEAQRRIAREIGDRYSEGNAANNLGNAYKELGEDDRAVELYKERLAISKDIGDQHGEESALGNLGLMYLSAGNAKDALDHFDRALVIAREIGDRRGEGNAQFNMSLALYQLGEQAKAIQSTKAALKLYEQIDDRNVEKVRKKLAEWERGQGSEVTE